MYKIIVSYWEYKNNRLEIDANSKIHNKEYTDTDLNRLWKHIENIRYNHRLNLYTPIHVDYVSEE